MSEIEGQGSLLEARKGATRAVAKAESHADPTALDYWLAVVWEVARKKPEFSTNAVLAEGEGGPKLWEPRALGAVMRRAQSLGVVRPTGRYEPDTTPAAHARPKPIWRSLIYKGES